MHDVLHSSDELRDCSYCADILAALTAAEAAPPSDPALRALGELLTCAANYRINPTEWDGRLAVAVHEGERALAAVEAAPPPERETTQRNKWGVRGTNAYAAAAEAAPHYHGFIETAENAYADGYRNGAAEAAPLAHADDHPHLFDRSGRCTCGYRAAEAAPPPEPSYYDDLNRARTLALGPTDPALQALLKAARPFATSWVEGGKMPISLEDWPLEARALLAALAAAEAAPPDGPFRDIEDRPDTRPPCKWCDQTIDHPEYTPYPHDRHGACIIEESHHRG